MRRTISLLLACVLFLLSGVGVVPALAATATPTTNPSTNGQALEIAPPVIYLPSTAGQSIAPGQSVKTQIFLRNVSKGNLIVTGQANDFVASGEDGTPKLLVGNDSDVVSQYSLKDWVSPPENLLLVPREIKSMTITVNVPKNASPGGHYGVIRFTATPPELQGTGVSLSASLGALILLTVSGDIKENVTVKEFSVNHNNKTGKLFESGPLTFVERFQNSGNVHEQPTGQVAITDMFGKKFASVNVNLPPKSVLPGSIRKFESSLDSTVIGNKKLFGRYRASLSVTYGSGSNKKTLTSAFSFWIIPYRLIAVVIGLLVVGFFVLRFLIRRYNRAVLNRANKQRKN